MIQALIVDDEKLVRKGLIAMMPWKQYDIEVVGEANNGKTALEFLQQQSVDLLFSDLSMPVMDGFDLMKEVRKQYPHVQIVVLTCHQDFDFIQETLRLGAIDYIVKTQIEQDGMEEVLQRIVARMQYEYAKASSSVQGIAEEGQASSDEHNEQKLFAYLLVERQSMQQQMHRRERMADYEDHWRSAPIEQVQLLLERFEIDSLSRIGSYGAILSLQEQNSVLENQLMAMQELILLQIPSIKELAMKRLTYTLQSIGMESFFYYHRNVWQGNERLQLTAIEQQQAMLQKISEDAVIVQKLQEDWLSFQWLTDVTVYEGLVERTEMSFIEPKVTLDWLQLICIHWKPFMTDEQVQEWEQRSQSISFWEETVHCLQYIRQSILQMMQQYPYYKNIIAVIAKALYHVQSTGVYNWSRDELADKFNISRSYFSQCFKDIVGTTYGHYIKALQIEKAKQLLQTGDEPIYWIAEHCGYKDEKYFSKLFKEAIGLSPSAFRKAIRERSMHDEAMG